VKAVEKELAIDAVSGRCTGEIAIASNAGMLARHRSSHLQSIADVLRFSVE